MFEVICTTHPVARKQHKCSYCGGVINIGEKYEKQVCKYDDVYTWKSHGRCIEIAYKLKMFDDCDEGLTSYDFCENIHYEYFHLQKVDDDDEPEFYEQLDYVCNYHLKTE